MVSAAIPDSKPREYEEPFPGFQYKGMGPNDLTDMGDKDTPNSDIDASIPATSV
jgi:hypothetical protein